MNRKTKILNLKRSKDRSLLQKVRKLGAVACRNEPKVEIKLYKVAS